MPTITNKKMRPRNARLDWDAFLDGKQRTCKHGKDFIGLPDTFQQRARHAAKRRGMKAVTWTEGNDVVVQWQTLDEAK